MFDTIAIEKNFLGPGMVKKFLGPGLGKKNFRLKDKKKCHILGYDEPRDGNFGNDWKPGRG